MRGLDTSYYLVDIGSSLRGLVFRWYSLENPWYDRAVLTPSLFTFNVTPAESQQAGPKVVAGRWKMEPAARNELVQGVELRV